MKIEQAQYLRVLWQSNGSPNCQHSVAENEYYHTGEPTGLLVCFECGGYLLGDFQNNKGMGNVR